jgi:hypothetical protein
MDTNGRGPSYICPRCGEGWLVEPIEQDRWLFVRYDERMFVGYGDHSHCLIRVAFAPECPDCEEAGADPLSRAS